MICATKPITGGPSSIPPYPRVATLAIAGPDAIFGSRAAREKTNGITTAYPIPVSAKPARTNVTLWLRIAIESPKTAVAMLVRTVATAPKRSTKRPPHSRVRTIATLKTAYPSAACASVAADASLRKTALQSAMAPSPMDAEKAISPTSKRGPRGNANNGPEVAWAFVSIEDGLLYITARQTTPPISATAKKCSNGPRPI